MPLFAAAPPARQGDPSDPTGSGRPAGLSLASLPRRLESAFGGVVRARVAACAVVAAVAGLALSAVALDGIAQHSNALAGLAPGVALFAGSTIVLLLLAGQASLRHAARAESGEKTNAALREIIEALPAGVLLFDKDERLVLHNRAALQSSPALRHGATVGMSYSEIVELTYARAAEFGAPLANTPAEWIDRFRSKGEYAMRQAIGKRWFEWTERPTPSGGTVALRTEITDLILREQDAERSRNLLQRTLDALPAGVTLYDRDERLAVYNKAAAAMNPKLAWPQAIGRTFAELSRDLLVAAGLSAEAAESEAASWVARFRSGGHAEIFQLGDGRWVAASEHAAEGGGTVGLRLDVSELKAREQELERSRNILQETLDALPAGITLYDRDERLVAANKAALSINPHLAEPGAIGTTFADLSRGLRVAAGQSGEVLERGVRRAVARFRGDGSRDVFRIADGRWIEASEHATASVGTVGLRADVSELKQREEELERSRAEYRSIVESSGASMLLVDRNLDIVMANQEFWKSSGLVPEDTIGQPWIEKVDPVLDPLVLKTWLSGPIDEEQARPVQYTRRRRDAEGRERLFAVTATPIVGADRLLQQMVFLSVDETERRDAEQLLVDTERLATVGEMAATVAHEIAQPLQVINIAAANAGAEIEQAQAEGKAPDVEFMASRLARIADQVARAGEIIGQLRSFVRGSSSDAAARFDPGEAIRSAVDLTRHGAEMVGTRMEARIDGRLPAVTGHLTRLEQVLVNLINNARDAGAREIVVNAAGMLHEGRRDMVRIAVDDSGPGIPPDIMPRLFESFVTTKPRGKGTGLGLRICRRIVEEMGGTISAANRPEGGARFEVLLPSATTP